jgi:site-specific DNA recombinase
MGTSIGALERQAHVDLARRGQRDDPGVGDGHFHGGSRPILARGLGQAVIPTAGSGHLRSVRRGTAAIYVRISEDREGAGLGTARQEADCRPICVRRGYPPERIRLYEDNDTSAYSGKRRAKYEQLLADVTSGEVTLVTAWHPDRLHRSPVELEQFIAIVERANIEVETARAGALDLSTPSGRMVARQLGAVARYESEHKSDRQRRKHQELADQGRLAGGGTRPFGYNDDRRTLHSTEAEHLREAAQRVLLGESIRALCRDFTARGITTITGGPWAPTVLRSILTSARISGRREYGRRNRNGRTVLAPITCIDAEWEAIISAQDSDALRSLLTSPSRRRNWGMTERSYLLRGVARCGLCAKPLVARPRADRRRCYVCASGPGFNGCGKIRVLADELEADVSNRLLLAVDEGELDAILSASGGVELATARDEVVARQERLAALAAERARDEISDAEWRVIRPELLARLEDTQRRYDAARGKGSLATLPRPLAGVWAAFDPAQRRATVTDLIAEVRVAPAIRGLNRYDSSRISLVWNV